MNLKKTPLLKVNITSVSRREILESIKNYLAKNKANKPLTVFTPNPEQIVAAQKNKEFRDLLNTADVALPDGEGVVWAVKKLTVNSSQLTADFKRIPGVEFMEDLIKLAAEKKYPLAFIGGRDGVGGLALQKLQQKYLGLTGWAQTPPEFNIQYPISNTTNEKNYIKELIDRIKETDVRLVFIGLGAPKQEFFITALSLQLIAYRQKEIHSTSPRPSPSKGEGVLFMSVGGAFDIFSGKLMRAPKIFLALHLEWLWRLVRQPSRIGRQINLLKFVWLVIRSRFVLK